MANAADTREARLRGWSGVLAHGATFALYLGLAVWASKFMFADPDVPLIWPATGVALAAIWRFGYPLTLTVFAASTLSYATLGVPAHEATLLALGNSVAAVIGAGLLRRLHFRGDLARMPELFKLIAVGIGATGLLSGTSGALVLTGMAPELTKSILLCWLADGMGVLLFAPLAVSLRRERFHAPQALALLAALVVVPLLTFVVYSSWIPDALALPLSYAVFPMVMLVALRFPPWAAAAVTLLAAMVAIQCTAMNKGPFAHEGMGPDLLSLHAQLALLAATGLFLAVLRQERLAAEARAREHLHMLARAGRINAMSALAAGIAHEINQPLCALSSYAQSANRMLARGASTDELRVPLERVVTTADRASDIVRRTRRFLAGGEARNEAVDLNDLARDARGLLEPEFRRRNVTLDLVLCDAAVVVEVEPLGMQQVLVNLMQNALESVDAGGNAARRWVRVQTALAREGREVVLSVVDGGPGLPDPDDEGLFDPFTTTRQSGTGLGLAIARSIIEAEGGRIDAANEPGAGACFRIRLPVRDQHPGPNEEASHG
ncbi:MASE1 domain-containing protein [Aquisalimonas lutea]|uniref:sensor histidine kinase n=1 Tax=Aquisalimonas lutea TaxID=1327750 RepID=UPI0025B4C691|nr:MASE1 domain-containing protein [Aquisalimonas lutea]MDN3519639.1 MASE1 domain-containing protein [Aquisalimonas lutea]